MEYCASRERIMYALSEGGPRSCSEVAARAGLSKGQTNNALLLAWRRGLILRTTEPIYETERVNRGRGGVSSHTRPYHLYLARPGGRDEVSVGGRRYVCYSDKYLDPRGGGSVSKAGRVLEFLRLNGDRAFYTTKVAGELAVSDLVQHIV